MAGENDLIIRINANAKNFIDELDKVKKKVEDTTKVLEKVGTVSGIAFAASTAAITLASKAYADYQTALVGVGKTTDITGQQLKDFGKKFQDLATKIPVSTNELLGIAQAAGQLGVKGEENLLKFTDTVAKLGVATDLTGEEAATALTRIINVTGESISSIDTLGSVIVAMGNNFAATESEIVRVTTEVAKSTSVFNVSAASSVALATAMKSLGVQAELGGSAIGRTFRAIDKSIRAGGASLENLSAVTGMTGEMLRKTFKEDSVEVFRAFIEGLGKIDQAGGSSTEALAAFGLKGDEILKVLPVLAKNSNILADTFSTAAKEVNNATALNKEAANAFNTLNSEVQLAKNEFENLKVEIGEKLAPTASNFLGTIRDIISAFRGMDASTIQSIATMLKWTAIISGLVTGIAAFLYGAIQVSGVITAIGTAFLPATIAASAFWVALTGPIGIAVAGLAAVATGVTAFYVATNKKSELPNRLEDINRKLEEQKKLLADLEKFQKNTGGDSYTKSRIENINAEISKLEELRQAKIKQSKDFGTGEFLVKPKATGALSDLVPTFGNTTIPLSTEIQKPKNTATDETKKETDKQAAILDEATRNRIAAAKRENEALNEIQAAKNEGLLAQDIAVLTKKAQIEDEFAQARLIKNSTERELMLQNLELRHADELAKIAEFEAQRDAYVISRAEEKRALDEELNQLSAEQRAAFTNEELIALQSSIDSKAEAEKKYNDEKIRKNIETQNKYKQDELKFGIVIAEMKKFFNSEEVQGVKDTTAQLTQLQNSKNSTMKGIGKAAASTNAAIATAEGAIKAYTSLAGIPIVGPALGIAAAAALTAYGVEQQGKILGANRGGIVPSSIGSVAGVDSVPAMLTPNELVVPAKSFDEVVNATAQSRNNENTDSVGNQNNIVIQGDFYGEETFIDRLAEKLYEAQKNRNVRLV